MKMLLICLMMCLATLTTEAQVLTSVTTRKVYENATANNGGKFAYDAEYNAAGDISTIMIYKKNVRNKGNVTLKPISRYEYVYDVDGTLLSKTIFTWHHNDWQCMGRHDYTLTSSLYSVEYSRWNQKKKIFDSPVEKMVYTLKANDSINIVAYYHRYYEESPLTLESQVTVIGLPFHMDNQLTQK